MPFIVIKFADKTIRGIKAQNKDSHIRYLVEVVDIMWCGSFGLNEMKTSGKFSSYLHLVIRLCVRLK